MAYTNRNVSRGWWDMVSDEQKLWEERKKKNKR